MRVCPICDHKTEETVCPQDGYSTIDLDAFQDDRATDPLVGRVLRERYRILRRLGAGGMGAVYLGTNIPLRQDIAIKVMAGEMARDVNAVKRFHREALSTSRLSHPNTVRVFDFGHEPDGLLFLVMEYVKGLPLAQLLQKDGAMPPRRVVPIARQILGALAEAHAAGIIHRDLKPQNVMIMEVPAVGDFAKVVDFGIAKMASGTGETSLTRGGVSIGSPMYMSPEQAACQPVDARSDLYSLGVLLYEMLSGDPPFQASTPLAVIVKHSIEAPPPLPDGVPQGLACLVERLLEKQPANRPQSAEEVLHLLEAPDLLSAGTSGSHRRASRPIPAVLPLSPVSGIQPAVSRSSPSRRSWWLAAGVGAGICAGLALFLIATRGGPNSASSPGAASVPDLPAFEVVSHDSGPPAERTVVVRSDPEGAIVFEGTSRIGVAPIPVKVTAGVIRELTVSMPGFLSLRLLLDDSAAEVTAKLVAEPAAAPKDESTPASKPSKGRKKPNVEMYD